MGKSSNKLGTVVMNHQGYSVRQIMNSKTNSNTKRTEYNHTGKYGIYAGKKLIIGDIDNADECLPFINGCVKESIRHKEIQRQAAEKVAKNTEEVFRKANRRTW